MQSQENNISMSTDRKLRGLLHHIPCFLAVLFLTSAAGLTGCASIPRHRDIGIDYSKHIIAVDREGAFTPVFQKCESEETGVTCSLVSSKQKRSEKETKRALRESEEELARHLDNIEVQVLAYRDDRIEGGEAFSGILFFIHGGLNSERARFDRVLENTAPIRDAGFYPIFISWESGPVSTYFGNLLGVRDGKKIPLVTGILTSPFYLARDLVSIVAAAPVGWYSQISGHAYGFYKTYIDPGFRHVIPFVEPAVRKKSLKGDKCSVSVDANRQIYPNADVCFAFQVDSNQKNKALRFLIHLLTLPAKAITTPTTMSIGVQAWDNMVRRTRTLMHRTDEFEPSVTLRTEPIYPEGTGAVSLVAKRLMTFQKAMDRDREKQNRKLPALPITMIGHSMGTIVINQILENYPDVEVENIVYMASAASVRDTSNAIYPYMNEHKRTEFYSLTLHPYADRRERSIGGLFPSGSLLQWIDEMYGHPVTDTDRTVGKWENVEHLLYMVPPGLNDEDGNNRVHITVFGFDKKCSSDNRDGTECDPNSNHPTHHGDFSNLDYWNPLVWGEP